MISLISSIKLEPKKHKDWQKPIFRENSFGENLGKIAQNCPKINIYGNISKLNYKSDLVHKVRPMKRKNWQKPIVREKSRLRKFWKK